MTDVELLREYAGFSGTPTEMRSVLLSSADRIEKLEAALRDIVNERGICGHCGKLASGNGKRAYVICDETVLGFKGPCHWTPQDPKDIARKALEGKDD